ncbi:MAG: hypothetical protein ACLFVQ_12980, partial [Chitinispirillaceae bacterium]
QPGTPGCSPASQVSFSFLKLWCGTAGGDPSGLFSMEMVLDIGWFFWYSNIRICFWYEVLEYGRSDSLIPLILNELKLPENISSVSKLPVDIL